MKNTVLLRNSYEGHSTYVLNFSWWEILKSKRRREVNQEEIRENGKKTDEKKSRVGRKKRQVVQRRMVWKWMI